jgi:C1A family cysteine protease
MAENFSESKVANAEAAAARAKAKALRPWYLKKRFIIPAALVVVIAFSAAGQSGKSDAPNTASNTDSSTSSSTDAGAASPSATPSASLTLGQENAIESAQSYLDYSGFSRKGLLNQLTSKYGEGFPRSDAQFAITYLEQNDLVDWNAEAVESANSYLETSSFSKSGLFQQLTSKYGAQFTPEQANYALKKVGY